MENQGKIDAITAQIEALKKQAKALKPKPVPTLTFKVQEKGTISVYGLQKFPVSLYPTQWEALSKVMGELMKIAQPLADAHKAAAQAKIDEAKTA